MSTTSIISMRAATDQDDTLLRELSELDSARHALEGPAVVALLDGRPVAAASLRDGSVVADPFVPTADVVELLQARVAASTREARSGRPRGRRRRPVLRLPRLRAA